MPRCGAVRCVVCGGRVALLSVLSFGSLFDTRRGLTDLGFLAHHEGSVTCLAFHPVSATGAPPSHLLSGGADGALCVWAAGARWDKLKALKAHRGGVNALAVHPSGLLALSCGRDRGLRLWDLVKGRCTYKTRMAVDGDALAFSPDGASYRVVCGADVALFDVATGALTATLHADSRVLALGGGAAGGAVITAGEKGAVAAWDARTGGRVAELREASGARIRGVAVPWGAETPAGGPVDAPPGHDALPRLVATASSDGIVRLWDMRRAGAGAEPLCSVATRARLTCLMAAPPGGAGSEARAPPAQAPAAARRAVVAAPAAPARRVAVDAAPRAGGVHGARLDRKDAQWWEAGEKGPKLSAQFDKLREERVAAERAARGINIRELKAAKAAGGGDKQGGGRGGGGEGRGEGGRGGFGEGSGRGGGKRGRDDRGDRGGDEERPRKGGAGRGGGGQGAKAGERVREPKRGGSSGFGGSFKPSGGRGGGGRGRGGRS